MLVWGRVISGRVKAYKKLSLVYHPDKTAGMSAEQKEEPLGLRHWHGERERGNLCFSRKAAVDALDIAKKARSPS